MWVSVSVVQMAPQFFNFYEHVGVCPCVVQTAPQFIWACRSLLLHCLNFCSGFGGPLCMWVSVAVVQTSAQFWRALSNAGVCDCCSDLCSVFEDLIACGCLSVFKLLLSFWRDLQILGVYCCCLQIQMYLDSFSGYWHNMFDFFQFGLATFQWSTLTGCYEAQTYNFYIFPRPSGGMDYRFTCQVWCKQVSGDWLGHSILSPWKRWSWWLSCRSKALLSFDGHLVWCCRRHLWIFSVNMALTSISLSTQVRIPSFGLYLFDNWSCSLSLLFLWSRTITMLQTITIGILWYTVLWIL
jgi:hypothetical protein